jgi:hypothetical protein
MASGNAMAQDVNALGPAPAQPAPDFVIPDSFAPGDPILFYRDLALGDDVFDDALANLGLGGDVTFTDNPSVFADLLDDQGWGCVIALNQNGGGSSIFGTALAAYVAAGGRAIFTDWTLNFSGLTALYDAFEVAGTGDANENQQPITTDGNAIWAGVPAVVGLTNPGWRIWSFGLAPVGGGVGTGTFPNGDAAVMIGNGGSTAFNGFLSDTFTVTAEGIQIAENQINEICFPEPELTKEIVSGNDVDGDGAIDLVVEVGIEDPSMYDFKISWFNPFGVPVVILDTVPAEWDVEVLDGVEFYATPSWADQSIYFLDSPADGLGDVSSFPVDSDLPNGLGTDGTFLYSGHFTTQEVLIYDLDGNLVGGWPTGAPNLQGLTIVGDELAITQDDEILFFDPASGVFNRSIPNAGGITVEGLTFDGALLWLLANDLIGVDPADGSVIATIPNAALGETFGGTGITSAGAGQLVLAGTSGNWWLVSSADGSVLDSGNNGLDMFGLTRGVSGIPNDLICEAASANKKDNGKSATKITCYPETESGMSAIWAMARCHDNKKNKKCRPTSCGALYLNDGAAAYEVDEAGDLLYPPIAVSNRLCLAAVEDLGDGLVYDGTGDVDGDGLLDYEEACEIGTDPCLADTDGDGVPDGEDACPLDGDMGSGVDADGCPMVSCQMNDNFGYEWNLVLEDDGTVNAASSANNIYASTTVSGAVNPLGAVSLTATNDNPVDGCSPTDSFTYTGTCSLGISCSGTWESFDNGGICASGGWNATFAAQCLLWGQSVMAPGAPLPAPAVVTDGARPSGN